MTVAAPKIRRLTIFIFIAAAIFLFSLFQFLNTAVTSSFAPPLSSGRTAAAQEIETLQAKLLRQPENATLYAQLGLAYLQRVRETGDSTYYTLADNALSEALGRDAEQYYALVGQGTLALARHDFLGALSWGEQARLSNPFAAEPLAILVDGYIELGRYEEAAETLQTLVNLKPGVAAYSRISYLRELHGDVAGAIEAMRQAAEVGTPGNEASLWTTVQLGNLYLHQGQLAEAQQQYEKALFYDASYPFAIAGLGRIQAAQGDYTQAIATFLPLTERYPLPEFVITLGDLYTLTGQSELAQRQYELVYLMQELNSSAGMDTDLEMALFAADHSLDSGRSTAEVVAQATAAYERRPSVEAADVLAWALYQNGEVEAAWEYSQEALTLGTRSARYHYHAAVIAEAVGDKTAAQEHLATALEIDPYFSFSLLHAAEAN